MIRDHEDSYCVQDEEGEDPGGDGADHQSLCTEYSHVSFQPWVGPNTYQPIL